MKHLVYIIFFFLGSMGFSQNDALFEQGNDLYNKGEYDAAISKYDAIIASGEHSAELYFNLGNAHYKMNHVAPSIYFYEKSLQLKPNDKEIINNIAFARNMTIDAVDVIPEAGFSKFLNNLSGKLTFDGWAISAIILVFLCVILFLTYYFSSYATQKRVTFIGCMTSLVLAFFALGLALHNYQLVENDQPAIIFAQESEVKSEPNMGSDEAFKLHEGTKVQILDTVNNWKKIKLADGKTGWIPKSDIKTLLMFP